MPAQTSVSELFKTPDDYPFEHSDRPQVVDEGDYFHGRTTRFPGPDLLQTPTGQALQGMLWGLINEQPDLPGRNRFDEMADPVVERYVSGGDFQDPRTSPLYQGLRDESRAEEERGASSLRRFAQKGGMLRSGPHFTGEGRYRADMAGKRASLLGSLYERERDRNDPARRAATALQFANRQTNLDTLPYTHRYSVLPALAETAARNETVYQPQYGQDSSGFEKTMAFAQMAFPFVELMMRPPVPSGGGGGGSFGMNIDPGQILQGAAKLGGLF